MKIITDVKEANHLLQSYAGALFQVYMYSASLKRIALRLMLSDIEDVVYIVGVGTESINGRFSFTNANFFIALESEKTTNEVLTRITDKSSGFELITSGGFSLAQGKESEFGTSFDNFLTDKVQK